ANAQSVTTAEDTAKAITLTASDVDGDTLTYSIVSGPSHGSLSGAAPNVTYTPAANYNGPDSFTFKANDGTADSAAATVSITVTAVNDAPVANAQSATTNEDTAKPITLAATDVDGDALTYSIVTGPAHGSLSGTMPDVSYTPAANYNGPDSFTFKANDGTVDSNVATVSLTVTAVNDAPSFTKGANQSVMKDSGAQTVAGWASAISAGPADESSQALNFIVTNDNTGLFSAQPAISSTGTLTYTSAAGATGSATVTVQLHDDGGTANGGADTSAAQTFTITITPPPTLTINDVSQLEGNSGITPFVFTISLNPAATVNVTVNYQTLNGTAATPRDYTAVSGTLTFTPGQTSKTVTVNVNGDTTKESNETFALRLSNAVNAAIGDNEGLGTILDDDNTPHMTVSSTSLIEGNNGGLADQRLGVADDGRLHHVRRDGSARRHRLSAGHRNADVPAGDARSAIHRDSSGRQPQTPAEPQGARAPDERRAGRARRHRRRGRHRRRRPGADDQHLGRDGRRGEQRNGERRADGKPVERHGRCRDGELQHGRRQRARQQRLRAGQRNADVPAGADEPGHHNHRQRGGDRRAH
ncbi:MAG: hypothetical protein DMG01_26015, partial [Acidobacteria bacterium]